MAKSYTSSLDITPRNVNASKPLDVRCVVDTYTDLYDRTTFLGGTSSYYTYLGMVVSTKDTGDVYVLTKRPSATQSSTQAKYEANIIWKKIGGADIEPEDYLEYYQENIGARVVSSVDNLVASELNFSYVGMFAVVPGDPTESDDESGLYVLLDKENNIWQKIVSGVSSGSSTKGDVVISDGGETPQIENGFSISSNKNAGDDPDVFVQEDYASDKLDAEKFYTSRGLNSSDKNGGDDSYDEEFIVLTNGGTSYVKLYATSGSDDEDIWMVMNFSDDSLPFGSDEVKFMGTDGIVYDFDTLEAPIKDGDTVSLPLGWSVAFDNGADFTGMTEVKSSDLSTEYVFGETGSSYEDIDMYSSTVLPTVYAYADGTSVRVLTEGDKTEILNIIGESVEPDRITELQIDELFRNI